MGRPAPWAYWPTAVPSLFCSPTFTLQLPSGRPHQQLAGLVPIWCKPLPLVKALLSFFQSSESVSIISGSSKNEGSLPPPVF